MQFFTVTDQSSIKHKVLVIPLNQKEMTQLVGQCEKCMPSISISSIIQIGHPYVIVDFGGGTWKTAIALDEESEDGHRIGDELEIGDVLNVILTSDPKAAKCFKRKSLHECAFGSSFSIQFPLHCRHRRKLCIVQDD